MDEALLEAFRSTHYWVCLDACEWADIRIDQPLPAAAQALVEKRGWGVITAWNPLARLCAEVENVAAQRELHAALTQLPSVIILPAIGIGSQWHEPSLFALGVDCDGLDALARKYRQVSYVHGSAGGPARLRLLG